MKKTIAILICVVMLSCKQEKKQQIVKLEGFVFGTTYHITYVGLEENNHEKSIDSLFHLINKSLSTYMPTSDISNINNGNSSVIVDAFFTEVFKKSKEIHHKTNGFFDPTVGNLVNAWGFGPKEKSPKIDSSTVQEMMQFVGFDKVQLEHKKVKKEHSKIFLDFNSIAKGYGVDVVGRFLEGKNISNYLVEIGGEIRARGKNNKNKFWSVAIEKPNTDGSQSFEKIITLENQSMATSGNYRKFRIAKNGKKYVHTINPKTGFATESNLLSASVISSLDCADVDAYATAFMAMGFEEAKKNIKKNTYLKVYFIYVDDKGLIQHYASK